MMKLLILATLLALNQARVIDEKCDGVIVHNINYEKEILKDNLDSPYQFVIDYDTNYLFFSYSANTDEVFKSAYINLKTNDFGIISGIGGGFANTVDGKKHKVYLGGRDGVYEFVFDTKGAKHLGGSEYSIWQMFFKDKLYFTSYPEEEVYTFTDGVISKVPELNGIRARLVALDNKNNLYYANSSGLFCNEQGNVINLGDYNLNGLVSDVFGVLYFSTPDGIYIIKEDKSVEKLATIADVFGVAIEGDGNIIYASSNNIVRLKPTKYVCALPEKNV